MNQELVGMLKDLNIYTTIDGFFSPDLGQVNTIYERFCSIINCDENYQIDNPQLHLFYRCKIMCRTIGINDFQIQDLIDPDPKRLRHIMIQLCKYCYWQKEQLQRWDNRIKEIEQLEEVDLVEIRNQKKEKEDYIALSMQNLESRKNQLEQMKQRHTQLRQEFSNKQSIRNKLQQTLNGEKQELVELKQRIENLREKQELIRNELICLDGQIVKDPKRLEQRVKDSSVRLQGLEQDLDKIVREKRLEEFKINIYNRFVNECEEILNKIVEESNLLLRDQDMQVKLGQIKNQINTLRQRIQNCQSQMQQFQIDRQKLLEQKSKQEQCDTSQQQQSHQQLVDLQNQLMEFEGLVKKDNNVLQKLRNEKNKLKEQLIESEQDKQNIINNQNIIMDSQLNEVIKYTQTIVQLINNIQF